MNTDIKQAMHVEAAKSFGTSEANENGTVAQNLSLAAIMNVHLRWLLAIRPSI